MEEELACLPACLPDSLPTYMQLVSCALYSLLQQPEHLLGDIVDWRSSSGAAVRQCGGGKKGGREKGGREKGANRQGAALIGIVLYIACKVGWLGGYVCTWATDATDG